MDHYNIWMKKLSIFTPHAWTPNITFTNISRNRYKINKTLLIASGLLIINSFKAYNHKLEKLFFFFSRTLLENLRIQIKSSMKIFHQYFGKVFTNRIVPNIIFIGIYWWNIFVYKYRGNPNWNKRNFKNQKEQWHVIFCWCFYRHNYSWMQIEKAGQWRVSYTYWIADGKTKNNIPLVTASLIVNIS